MTAAPLLRPAPLLFRADASPAIGMGHAMRCLALGETYGERAGGQAIFLMADPLDAFVSRAAVAGAEVRALVAAPGSDDDVRDTLATAGGAGAGWIVLDGYGFDGAFQAAVRAGGSRVLALDDHGHAGRYHADVVLNQNAGAEEVLYRDREATTHLLLGPRFALLRREFRHWPAQRRETPARARRVVVTLGGGDPDNVSARVLEGLATVPGPLEVALLIGPANPHRAALEAAAAGCPHPVALAADVRDMAPRLAWADLAVTAAGSTMYELARVGTPQLLVVLADNQEPGAAGMAREGLAVKLGWHASLDAGAIGAAVNALADDAAWREECSRRGRELVDGGGAMRVLAAMGLAAETEVAA